MYSMGNSDSMGQLRNFLAKATHELFNGLKHNTISLQHIHVALHTENIKIYGCFKFLLADCNAIAYSTCKTRHWLFVQCDVAQTKSIHPY